MAINVKDKLVTLESLGVAYSAEQDAREEADQALSTRIDNIVAPEGDPSLTEVSDARVSGSTTYNNLKARLDGDKAAIETEISQLSADLTYAKECEKVDLSALGRWSVGGIDPSNGANIYSTTRIRTDYIKVSSYTSITAVITSGYKWRAFFYNSSKTYLSNITWSTVSGALLLPNGTFFIRLLMADTLDSTATIGMSAYLELNASYKLFDVLVKHNKEFERINNQIGRDNELLYDLKFRSVPCNLVNGTLVNPSNVNYISTAEYISVKNGQTIKCTVKTTSVPSGGHLGYGYSIYDSNKIVINSVGVSSSQKVDNVTLIYPNAAYIRWTVGVFDSSSTVVPQRADTFDGFVFVDVYGTVVGRNEDVRNNAMASCHSGLDYTYNGANYSKKLLSMLFVTDLHESIYAINNAVIYLNDVDFVDIGICMGDIGDYVASNGTWYTNLVNISNKPFYTILGNHDVGNSASLSYGATIQQAFNKWIAPTRTVMGMPSLAVPYYSVKNDDYKLVLIFLNNYDSDDSTNGNTYIVNRGFEVFRSTQIDWLLSTLDAVPSDYTVAVVMHSFPYDNTGIESNFTQLGQSFVGNGNACYTDLIPDIINAWKNGTALVKAYDSHCEGVTESLYVNHDFTARGNGIFACYFVGHSHRDVVAKSDTYTDQIVIGFAASTTNNYHNRNADLPRVFAEKTEDVITLATIDTEHHRINLCRIGSNKTFTMQDRTMTSILY